jgi:putative intracellular protease/amidase
MKIVMVLTSHDQLGNTGRKTGFWLEEFAAPYFVFRDAGVQLTLASPKGGQPPLDPKSDLPENQTPAMTRFKQDRIGQEALSRTIGRLVTGQNPASSTSAAQSLVKLIAEEKAA